MTCARDGVTPPGVKQPRVLSSSSAAQPEGPNNSSKGNMRKPINLIRTWARDRRMCAMHEAGHVVIARMLSVKVGYAYIYPVEADEESNILNNKTWLGQTFVNPRDLQRANRRERAMFGVAGAVAEQCWQGFIDDESLWYEPTMMSESDWEETGCVPGVPDENCLEAIYAVAAVLERGGSHWDDLVSVSRNLIIDSRPILRQFVEVLDDQRRQRQRVGLGAAPPVGTGDYDHSRHGGRPQAVRRVLHGRSVGRVDTQPARGGEIYVRRRLARGPLLT